MLIVPWTRKLTPYLRDISYIDQIDLQAQPVSASIDSARQDRANVQGARDLARIGFASVVDHDAARHDAQFRELRKTVDQALGELVAEVVSLSIGSFIDERKHGY